MPAHVYRLHVQRVQAYLHLALFEIAAAAAVAPHRPAPYVGFYVCVHLLLLFVLSRPSVTINFNADIERFTLLTIYEQYHAVYIPERPWIVICFKLSLEERELMKVYGDRNL